MIVSNIPHASGISSSSALECTFCFAVSECFEFGISKKDIALFGQQSEHDFMNVNCGIMDQYIISTAKEKTAELLDCSKITHEYIDLDLGDYNFVVMNTQKKRKLSDSKYNQRRSECEKGLDLLKKSSLLLSGNFIENTKNLENICSLSFNQFKSVSHVLKDETILKRVRHCVTENERVLLAVKALQKNDLKTLGSLLKESHKSLKDDYEVTGIELDTLTDAANKQPGCLGSRMTGAGFGGCAIALVHKDNIRNFIEQVQNQYKKIIGYEASFFACSTSNAVSRII